MNAKTFIATAGHGLIRSTRQADGQWLVELLLTDHEVRCLAADPLDSSVLYVGTQGKGVLRSGDRGDTWQPAGLAGKIVKSIAVSRAEPGVVYAGTKPPMVFVSRDHGTTWTELAAFRRIRSRAFWFSPAEPPGTAYVQSIALSPTDPAIILAGIEFGAVVRSVDGGKTWMDHRPGALRDCHSLMFHPTDGNWVYEGGGSGGGVAVSQDAGKTWQQPKGGLDRHYGWAVAADPAQPEVWYASLSSGAMKAHSAGNAQAHIFRSAGNSHWRRLSGGLPQPLNEMPYALCIDPSAPGHVYAGLSSGDVWHSPDHGETWRKLPFSLTGIHRALIVLS